MQDSPYHGVTVTNSHSSAGAGAAPGIFPAIPHCPDTFWEVLDVALRPLGTALMGGVRGTVPSPSPALGDTFLCYFGRVAPSSPPVQNMQTAH